MNVYVIDEEVGFPGQQTPGSQGHDLAARIDVTIGPKETKLVPCNVIVQYDDDSGDVQLRRGNVLLMFPRSGLWKKKHVLLTNSVGFIDRDYCGPSDEIMASLFNPTDEATTIKKGERIVQIAVIRLGTSNLIDSVKSATEIEQKESRGGFGSTGD